MSGARRIPWSRDPHTAAKHAVYSHYLSKWWPIVVRGFGGNVTYCEGFAGPGVYDQNEPGSPVIALRELLKNQSLKGLVNPARLLFVDNEPRCTELLSKRLVDAIPPHWPPERWRKIGIDIDVRTGDCEPTLESLLDEHQAWNHPILAILDTWGGGVSARLIRRFAENKAGEVIVTIQPQYFARFAEVKNIQHGDTVFGSSLWRDVGQQPSSAKVQWLRNQYRQTIEDCGFSYVLDFELVDEGGHVLYLVFGTNHKRGLQKMKEAMWEVDDVYGTRYRDPRDPNQETLQIELEPQTAPLRRLLLAHVASLPNRQASIHDLRAFALYRTVYKESQARQVVLELLADRKLARGDGGSGPVRFETVVRLP